MPEVIAIAAVARNGVIGSGGSMPWRLKGDLPRVKRLTSHHVLIMGRKTFDSLPGLLPDRTSIVITRNPDWRPPTDLPDNSPVEVASSLDQALSRAAEIDPDGPTVIFGGGDIYRAALDRCDRLELTEVHAEPDGDATFPAIDPDQWQEVARDDDHDGYSWVTLRRS